MAKLQEDDGWIDFSKKSPELGDRILLAIDGEIIVATKNIESGEAYLMEPDVEYYWDEIRKDEIANEDLTVWQPLPNLPTREGIYAINLPPNP